MLEVKPAANLERPRLIAPPVDDFPSMLPGVPLAETVKMVVEESIHYSLSPEARPAWYAAFPDGVGSVRLGLHHRTFFVYASFHLTSVLFSKASS
jgi:hypothetical protein